MSQLEDTTTFQAFWSALMGIREQARMDRTFNQFVKQTDGMALASLIDALDGAPDSVKSYIWKSWVGTADLSGANIYDILALRSEPPESVMHIVKQWLGQVNLKHFSLKEMKVLTEDSAGLLTADDIERFWLRWIQTTDLRVVHLVDFAKALRGLAPEIQLSCLNTYVANCPNVNHYGSSDRLAAKKHLSQWATSQCALFSSSSQAVTPKYRVGQTVRIAGLTGAQTIASVYQQNGVYYYWPENGQRYFPESEVTVA